MAIAKDRLEVLQVRKLIQCVRERDELQIDKIVEKGVPNIINFQDPEGGQTALHVAAISNDEKIVMKLLEHGAISSSGDDKGWTPVMSAAQHGHLEVLQALALKGINAGARDKNGKTVLFHCLHNTMRHARCLDFLVECGADPNQIDSLGMPVLCGACHEGIDRLVQVLLNRGADPNARESLTNKPALVLAAEGSHVECVKVLLKGGAKSNETYGDGLNAVHRAAALGHFDVLQTLAAFGTDFKKVTDLTQENAVHFALQNGNQNVIRFLGLRGCPANETTSEGSNSQKIAKVLGRKDLMKEVKKLSNFQDKAAKGGKVKGFTDAWLVQVYDWTIVHKSEVTSVLRGAEVAILAQEEREWEEQRKEAKAEGTLDSLERKEHAAGMIPQEEFIQLLTSLGAPFSPEDLTKLAGMHDKSKSGMVNYEEFLSEQKYINTQYKFSGTDDLKAKKKKGKKGKKGKGGKTKVAFPIVCEVPLPPTSGPPPGTIEKEKFFTDTQRFTREQCLPHDYVDDSMWYLLPPDREFVEMYEAVRHGDMESLKMAIDQQIIDVDLRDKYNKTPLMVASAHGRCDVAQLLVDKGANVDAIDNFCWTPLHHACHTGEAKVVEFLLAAGANIDAQGANGGTPLMRAIESTQRSTVKLLIDRGAKVTLENKTGDNALEVARKWGDDYILALVYTKFNTLPPPIDKKGKDKGKDKGKGKGKEKKKKKGDEDDELPSIGPPPPPRPPSATLPTPLELVESSRRNSSIGTLKAATSIQPSPHYRTRPVQHRPPNQMQIHENREKERSSLGIEAADFGEMRTPFTIAMTARAQAVDLTL